MNNREALQALLDGKKIRAKYWGKGNSIKMEGNNFISTIDGEESNYEFFIKDEKVQWELVRESIFLYEYESPVIGKFWLNKTPDHNVKLKWTGRSIKEGFCDIS